MAFELGSVVVSSAGHDKGNAFFVVQVEGQRVLLADGKRKKMAAPKGKNVKHLNPIGAPHHPVTARLSQGASVLDSELRRALAVLRDQLGGHDAWQKMI